MFTKSCPTKKDPLFWRNDPKARAQKNPNLVAIKQILIKKGELLKVECTFK